MASTPFYEDHLGKVEEYKESESDRKKKLGALLISMMKHGDDPMLALNIGALLLRKAISESTPEEKQQMKKEMEQTKKEKEERKDGANE